jgi:hypothetical protein
LEEKVVLAEIEVTQARDVGGDNSGIKHEHIGYSIGTDELFVPHQRIVNVKVHPLQVLGGI